MLLKPASDTFVAVTTSSGLLIAQSLKRSSLILFPPSGVTVTISKRQPVVLNQGLTWANANYPIILDNDRFGDYASSQLFVIGSAAFTMGILEVFNPDIPDTPSAFDVSNYRMLAHG